MHLKILYFKVFFTAVDHVSQSIDTLCSAISICQKQVQQSFLRIKKNCLIHCTEHLKSKLTREVQQNLLGPPTGFQYRYNFVQLKRKII